MKNIKNICIINCFVVLVLTATLLFYKVSGENIICAQMNKTCGGEEEIKCCGELRCVTPILPVERINQQGVCLDCPFKGDNCSQDVLCCTGLSCSNEGYCLSLIRG